MTLSSFAAKNVAGNRPVDFTTRFTPTIVLDNDASYYIGFNRIIDLSRIRHNHTRESMKVRLGWTIIKHGGELFEFFAWWS